MGGEVFIKSCSSDLRESQRKRCEKVERPKEIEHTMRTRPSELMVLHQILGIYNIAIA